MKSKACPRESVTGEPSLHLPCSPPASPHQGEPRTHIGAAAPARFTLLLRPSHFRPCSWHPRSTGVFHGHTPRVGRWRQLGPLHSHPVFTKRTSSPQNEAPLQRAARHVENQEMLRNSSDSGA